MKTRSGPEAIEQALHRMVRDIPDGATGIYVTTAGISYGYRNEHDDPAPDHYIFFKDPPQQQRYDEHIESRRSPLLSGGGDIITLVMNARQAQVLRRILENVGGPPGGARGTVDKLMGALHSAGVSLSPRLDNEEEVINGGIFFTAADAGDE